MGRPTLDHVATDGVRIVELDVFWDEEPGGRQVGGGEDLLLVVAPVHAGQVDGLETGELGELLEDRPNERIGSGVMDDAAIFAIRLALSRS